MVLLTECLKCPSPCPRCFVCIFSFASHYKPESGARNSNAILLIWRTVAAIEGWKQELYSQI